MKDKRDKLIEKQGEQPTPQDTLQVPHKGAEEIYFNLCDKYLDKLSREKIVVMAVEQYHKERTREELICEKCKKKKAIYHYCGKCLIETFEYKR